MKCQACKYDDDPSEPEEMLKSPAVTGTARTIMERAVAERKAAPFFALGEIGGAEIAGLPLGAGVALFACPKCGTVRVELA